MQMQGQQRVMAGDQLAPLVVARDEVLYKTVRGLAITQLIIGLLTVALGIIAALLGIWYGNHYQGIWGGVWILIAGLIGLSSSKYPSSCCIAGIYMAFTIVSTVIAFFSGILFVNGILSVTNSCFHNNDKMCDENIVAEGLGLMIPFLILMVVEFFVSIIASAYACKSTNCCTSCSQQQNGTTVYTTHQHYQISPSSLPQQHQPGGFPMPVSYPGAPPYHRTNGYHQPPRYPGYVQQPVVTNPASGHMHTGQAFGQPLSTETNIVYAAQPTAPPDMAPPPYDSLR